MKFHLSPSLVAALLTTGILAVPAPVPVPVEAIAMGSRHNLYLTTCTPKCLLGILCSRQSRGFTAVIYYANGAVDTLTDASPTQMTTVSSTAARWEGARRSADMGSSGAFSSNIDSGAASLDKGQIAGTAMLSDEGFACFRDGETTFRFSDNLGLSTNSCTADYWCPSVQV
ncbi:hypothetical protein EJ04DRAFT_597366 [Polyplosphaeria fusca]|uniref:Uncharacterized protein n=1 Tax=Polyplosphaeria fusca TaxID=682080 RepID=A0A9P4QL84_9PLEO|nr:hypothetical protein EJ04DRAFT_597366 [Polyplosphaeria fusca]